MSRVNVKVYLGRSPHVRNLQDVEAKVARLMRQAENDRLSLWVNLDLPDDDELNEQRELHDLGVL
jgi:hypothetical protein